MTPQKSKLQLHQWAVLFTMQEGKLTIQTNSLQHPFTLFIQLDIVPPSFSSLCQSLEQMYDLMLSCEGEMRVEGQSLQVKCTVGPNIKYLKVLMNKSMLKQQKRIQDLQTKNNILSEKIKELQEKQKMENNKHLEMMRQLRSEKQYMQKNIAALSQMVAEYQKAEKDKELYFECEGCGNLILRSYYPRTFHFLKKCRYHHHQ